MCCQEMDLLIYAKKSREKCRENPQRPYYFSCTALSIAALGMAVPFSLQANERRGEESIRVNRSPNTYKPPKILDHHKPRSQPQKRSGEAPILVERRLTSRLGEFSCKLPPKRQQISFFFSPLWLFQRKPYIVRDYNRNYISFCVWRPFIAVLFSSFSRHFSRDFLA